MALSGSLLDFTVIDVFQLIRMHTKEGVLTLYSRTETVIVQFLEGQLVFAENSTQTMSQGVESWMVKDQLISPELWSRGLALSKEQGKTMDQALFELGGIPEGTVSEYAQRYRRKVVFNLFRWLEGDYTFEAGARTYPTIHTSMPNMVTEDVLMETACRAEEWPFLEEKIGPLNRIYERVGDAPPKDVPGESSAPAEEVEDEFGFGDLNDEAETDPAQEEEEAFVWAHLDGRMDVNQLLHESIYAAFETCRALAGLIDKGGVTLVGEAEVVEPPEPVMPAMKKKKARPQVNWRPMLVTTASVSLIAVCAGLFLVGLSAPGETSGKAALMESAISYRDHKVRQALGAYRLAHGEFPDELQTLQTAGFVNDQNVIAGMRYRKLEQGYSLDTLDSL